MINFKSIITPSNKTVWIAFILACLSFEVLALYYQYALDFLPCVVCIHVRILLLGFLILSILGLVSRRLLLARVVVLLALLTSSAALIERSWQLLGTERGFIMGSCSFDLGLPSWLALDKWMPLIFKVQTACGYTPELAFGVSMAEVLLFVFCATTLFMLYLLTIVSKPTR
jgi:disulfide bond formation protein DsbB